MPKKGKTRVRYVIAAHPIQQAIFHMVQGKGIDTLSLRGIAVAIGLDPVYPQQIKHHLTVMMKYGFLDVVEGKYRVGSLLKKKQ
jgi:methyl coenzyme M reductase subunit C